MVSILASYAQQAPVADEDIREARGLIAIPSQPETSYALWWILLAFAIVAVLTWWILRSVRARRVATSPLAIAMQRLREIERQQAEWSDERYAMEVADVLRTYVVAVYQIAAPQRTSQEFLQECMRQERWPNVSLEKLRALLRSCDIAKFAAGPLSPLERQDMASQVRELVLVPVSVAEENQSSLEA
jgi:hypothetical protein